MIKTLKKFSLALVAAGLLASPLAAESGSEYGEGRGKHEMREGKKDRGGKMAKELGLSKDQKKQMKEIREKFKKKMEAHRGEGKAAHEALKKAMADPHSSESDLRARHEAVQKIMQAKGTLKFEKMLAIRQILDDEQIRKFAEMHKGRHGKKHGGPRHDDE